MVARYPTSEPRAYLIRIRFVSSVARAPARHAGDPWFESTTKHHFGPGARRFGAACGVLHGGAGQRRHHGARYSSRHAQPFSRSSKAEHPADNGETADRYRAGGPVFDCNGPGAFKPEVVGQRAFNPSAKRFDSSRVLQQRLKRWQNGDAPGCNPCGCRFDSGPLLQLAQVTRRAGVAPKDSHD